MSTNDLDIAIVGMACRFPGARTPEEYWENLVAGKESVEPLSDDQLRAAGVPDAVINDPAYVKVHAPIPDLKAFDGAFFGFSPRESAILDPQHRHFLETAWAAFEDAGHIPGAFAGPIGVFAGVGYHHYFSQHLLTTPELLRNVGFFLLRHTGNDKDFLATRVSYLLNLRGPSINVQTACSTSLVAVHLAVQSLLNGECEMAMAGGVTIELPEHQGYMYHEGEILSPDGHCRPFDAASQGTVFGSGCGAIVLRRLKDALRDGDTIHAVIKATAINNDGAQKVGYLAPSVEGHAQVAAEAIALSGLEPGAVSYIETHGTGTPVGDPIEIAALAQAYRDPSVPAGSIGIGSVKSNIGHTDTAAGIASLIKVVLSMKHKTLAPTLHFRTPNPACGFENTPFRVQATPAPWESKGLRRAAVSSLGVGGTNAHVILEEAPSSAPSTPSSDPQLLALSARTPAALERAALRLADHLEKHPAVALSDAAWSLQVGRQPMKQRLTFAASDRAHAITLLRDEAQRRKGIRQAASAPPPTTFLFAGGGAQYPGMGRDLYASEPAFRAVVDRGLALLRSKHQLDLAPLLLPTGSGEDVASEFERPTRSLPALYIIQTATAALWRSWGVTPTTLLGHSMGEYSAAHEAGVLSFEDGLALVVRRGELFERVPAGGMISVAQSAESVRAMLDPRLSIAAENSPELCVVSGPDDALQAFDELLTAKDIDHTRIRIRIAAHSAMLDPILDDWRAFLRTIKLSAPKIPIISNLTGAELTASDAVDPEYWVRQLRLPVKFSDGVARVLTAGPAVLIECGPGRVLTTLARQHPARATEHELLLSLRRPDDTVSDRLVALDAAGRAWSMGVSLDWSAIHQGAARRRVPLPTYPFERDEHWVPRRVGVAVVDESAQELVKSADVTQWGFEPGWRRTAASAPRPTPAQVLIVGGGSELRRRLAARLSARGAEITFVDEGDVLRERRPGYFTLDPERPEHFRDLFRGLAREQRLPELVVHAWNIEGTRALPNADRATFATIEPLGSVIWLAQAMTQVQGPSAVRLAVLTRGAVAIGAESVTQPLRAMAAATCRVVNTEADGISAHAIDVDWDPSLPATLDRTADALVAELCSMSTAASVALRRGERWEPEFVPTPLVAPAANAPTTTLRSRGVYLITGGLGGIGLEVAALLARRAQARLALVSRSGLPHENEWDARLADVTSDRRLRQQIEAVRHLRALGAEVLVVKADIADRREAKQVVRTVTARFGTLHGIFHAAGVLDDSLVGTKTPTSVDRVLRPKLHGALALDEATTHLALDHFVLFSSTSAFQGLAGQTDYAAANAFLDAFARWRADHRPGQSLAINWSVWQEVGMAAALADAQGVAVRTAAARVQAVQHHVLDRVVVDAPDLLELAGPLRADRHWVIHEHRVRGGDPVVPGTGYLDLAVTAARHRDATKSVRIEDVTFSAPCVVPEDHEREIRVRLTMTEEGSARFAVRSRPSESASEWTEHCVGRVRWVAEPAPVVEPVASVRSRCAPPVVIDRAESPSTHIDFGARWRNVHTRHLGTAEAVLEMDLGDRFADDLRLTVMHPALLDMGTAGAQMLLAGFDEPTHFFVPIGYTALTWHAPLEQQVVSHVRLRPGSTAESDTASFDVTLRSLDDRLLVEVEELTMFHLRDRSALRATTPRAAAATTSSPLAEALRLGIAPAEGMDVLMRALSDASRVQVVVAPAGVGQLTPRVVAPSGAGEESPEQVEERALELVPPRTPLQTEMVRIASELLGIKRLGITEDLVDRGLHSLLAVRLFNRLQRHTGRNVPLSALLDAPNIEKLAVRFGEVPDAAGAPVAEQPTEGDATPAADRPKGKYDDFVMPESDVYVLPPEEDAEVFSSLVPLKPSGSRTPFFVIHARGGAVLNYQPLTTFVDADQPIYGLQSQGLDGVTEPLRSIEAMAAHYITLVRSVQPHGPYLLGGGSLGGVIALEMAHQLRKLGEETSLLAMFDSWGPNVFMDTQRQNAVQHVGSKYNRIVRLVRERGVPRMLRQVYRRGMEFADEAGNAAVVRWHRVLQRVARRPLPHAVRYQFVERVNLAVLRVYRPQPWDGEVVLFRALDDPDFSKDDPSMGWTGTALGGIKLIDCPGTHNTIMKGPIFGAYLSQEIRRAQLGASGG